MIGKKIELKLKNFLEKRDSQKSFLLKILVLSYLETFQILAANMNEIDKLHTIPNQKLLRTILTTLKNLL